MKCRYCKERKSTGYLVQMCDYCFGEFEKRVYWAKSRGMGYQPTNQELECLSDLVYWRVN